jgi:hypothetical protein
MGYTHYWGFKNINCKTNQVRYEEALSQCEKIVQGYNLHVKLRDFKHPNRLSGWTAHCETGKYKSIKVNGTKDLAHEDFYLDQDLAENRESDFCKTARKPYDVVVVACLVVLKRYLGDDIEIDSDGYQSDWIEGLNLAKDITKIKGLKIPESIERRAA